MADSALSSRPPRARGQQAGFALLGCVQVTLIAAITVLTVALPEVQADLHTDEAGLVFASSAYGVAFGGFLLLGGRIADYLGYRRTLVAALSAFALACLAASLAPTVSALVAARFGQGTAAALAAPSAMALLTTLFPDPARRARAIATWGVFASVGATLGTVLSGLVLTWASWRWVFVAPAVVSVLVVVLAARIVPPGPSQHRSGLDLPGAPTVTAGLAVVIYGLGDASMAWILTGTALLAAFAVIEARSATPLVPWSFLLPSRRILALAAIILTAAAMTVTYFILALYLQQIRGYSALATSAMFLPPAVVLLAAGPLTGRIRQRLGAWLPLAVGLALAGAGCLLLGNIGNHNPGAAEILAGLLVFCLGAGVSFSASMVLATTGTSQHHRAGVSAAVANTAMEIGPPLGLAVLIPIASAYASAQRHLPPPVAASHGYALAFSITAAAFVVTAALALAVPRTIRKGNSQQS
jgi:MFS family permease